MIDSGPNHLVGDQTVECRPNVGGRDLVAPGRLAGPFEKDEPRHAADRFLVAGEGGPRGIAIDGYRLRVELACDGGQRFV